MKPQLFLVVVLVASLWLSAGHAADASRTLSLAEFSPAADGKSDDTPALA